MVPVAAVSAVVDEVVVHVVLIEITRLIVLVRQGVAGADRNEKRHEGKGEESRLEEFHC